jgi:UDP:flavonoid glycosyltransferase YjiC (YdhE family)
MRLAILASGSRGDVQPHLALGQALLRAGHVVHLVTHDNFGALVRAHGLEFWPVAFDVQAVAESDAMRRRVEGGNFLLLMTEMARAARQGALCLAEAALAASQGVDLLLAGMGGLYTALAVAEKRRLPLVQAYLVPFTPTGAFPGALFSQFSALRSPWLNRASHHLTRQLIWQGFRAADAVARRQILGLPPAPFWGPYASPPARDLPVLYGFSPAVLPARPDWPGSIQVTGYWFLDPPVDWAPPSALVDFLNAGAPPVYVGFGSMSSRDPRATADLVLQALQRTGQRALLLNGWGGLRPADLPPTVFPLDALPHAWLFPRVAAVVHHGGAGTTGAALRAGVPSIVVPFFGDQPFWGQRVAALGVGPRPIPRRQLSPERLAAAIQTAVTDSSMRRRAAALGSTLQAEDGLGRAVEIIGRL